jgi:HK97 gp10 family phage protein
VADDVTVEVKGLAELEKALEELPKKVVQRGMRKALKAGAVPVQNGMVTGAPKATGFLAKHFSTKIKLGSDGLSGSAFIGPDGKMDYPAYLSGAYNIIRNAKGKVKKVGKVAVASVARFLEFGTSKMSKKPFMTQAFENNKMAALDNITNSLDATIQECANEAPKGPTA